MQTKTKNIFLLLGGLLIAAGLVWAYSGGRNTAEQTTDNKSLLEYFNQAQDLATTQDKNTTTFLAVGDVSLSRNIAQTIKNTGDVLAPFKDMGSVFRSVDFTFGNLETPFSSSDAFTPKDTLVFNAPKANVRGLVEYKFKVLNLANNHALDQGQEGVTVTNRILDDNNLLHMGTGQSLDEAWAPVIFESNGIVIGFIGASYSSVNDGGQGRNNFVARIDDSVRLEAAITNLKPKVDFVVATMHAGTEYVREPNPGQIAFAHAAIDYGADIVIGHHSHWIQTIEQYKGKQIFYGLGNFIFDQAWSQETKEGLALKITLEKTSGGGDERASLEDLQGGRISAKITRIDLIPILIDRNCCPREALSIEAREILGKIGIFEQTITP